jgi:hypothetical protein
MNRSARKPANREGLCQLVDPAKYRFEFFQGFQEAIIFTRFIAQPESFAGWFSTGSHGITGYNYTVMVSVQIPA